MFILLTANCVVVVYKWLYSNFKNLEDTDDSKNVDYKTDKAFYIIIDVCYFVILFVLAIVQLLAYISCCILFKKLRSILKPTTTAMQHDELDNSKIWRRLEV